ncbi:MAG TPA: septal ring lytic transglycosylase RlpA family protein [Candidatus Aminicenantes bacterium]|nr:septal ring lytic transglycosylase RlpA family protein [Candidatus Aminicenantes bacterium]HRY65199.1 septal ring lytic transglycosylase RlpA family protein [Candidatus Aminicenantes bacterium]HRZ72333.1 septal ring lytic transglycosylase RlpA family protein [Candidatus Aminicenantes bacterium]
MPISRRSSRQAWPEGRVPGPAAGLAAALVLLAASACARQPRPAPVPGVETGLASWYGPEFHGRPTSSREVFDMNDLTAAHNSLPFGAYVMVTNLENDRSVVVRINDRGPFVGGRIIDLSYAAARVLGLVGPGTARVRLDVLSGFKAPAAGEPAGLWVQVGAFSVQENAYALKRRLETAFPGVTVSRFETGHGAYFRVRVPAADGAAETLAGRLAGQGYPVIIIRERP